MAAQGSRNYILRAWRNSRSQFCTVASSIVEFTKEHLRGWKINRIAICSVLCVAIVLGIALASQVQADVTYHYVGMRFAVDSSTCTALCPPNDELLYGPNYHCTCSDGRVRLSVTFDVPPEEVGGRYWWTNIVSITAGTLGFTVTCSGVECPQGGLSPNHLFVDLESGEVTDWNLLLWTQTPNLLCQRGVSTGAGDTAESDCYTIDYVPYESGSRDVYRGFGFYNGQPGNVGSWTTGLPPDCQILDVPLLKQTGYSQEIDHWGVSIRDMGCGLTSYAMIIKYYSRNEAVTPFALNQWLNDHNGWFVDDKGKSLVGIINPKKVEEYAIASGAPLYWKGWKSRNDDELNRSLCAGSPVMLGLDLANPKAGRPTHFVVATGQTTVGGTKTWTINNPAANTTDLLNPPYNNEYVTAEYWSTQKGTSALFIGTHPSLQFLVTDPQGRRAGYDPSSNVIVSEIPDAVYMPVGLISEQNPSIATPVEYMYEAYKPTDGTYTVQVWGLPGTTYSSFFYAYDESSREAKKTDSGIVPQSGSQFLLHYSSSDSQLTKLELVGNLYGDVAPIDGDVDGTDLAAWIAAGAPTGMDFTAFAINFGKTAIN
jgi:hypothetical protein